MGHETESRDGSDGAAGIVTQIADLAATYGAGEWLIDAPTVLLRALAEQAPRVQASASLRRVAEIALGSGTLKKHDAEKLHKEWLRAARAHKVAAKRVRTAEEFAAMAADLNIGFEGVKAG